MTIAIIMAIAEIFGLFMFGSIARRLGYISDNDIDRWTCFIIDFLLPVFSFTSILKGLDTQKIHELWLLPVTGFVMVVIFTVAGILLKGGLLTKNAKMKRTFLHLCAVNNSSFLPIIILRNIGGDGSLANLFLLYIGTLVGIWTIGIGVLGSGNGAIKERLKKLVSPNLIAIIAAIVIALLGGRKIIPELVLRILSSAGSSAPELMMLLIGATLAKRGTLRVSWQVVYTTIVRLLILPAMMIPLLHLLPFSKESYSVAVIVALMPTAISSVIYTRRYGGMPGYAASSALVTTVCSIITVPLAVWLLFR